MATLEALRRIPIRRSLIRPNLILGAERELVIFSGMLSAAVMLVLMQGVSVILAVAVSFGIWSSFLFVLTRMARSDPAMSKLYLKHIRYQIFYPAHGRINAHPRDYKSAK
jgi:type IV secretory pathway TrbD component